MELSLQESLSILQVTKTICIMCSIALRSFKDCTVLARHIIFGRMPNASIKIASAIVDFAVLYSADVIVFEHLDFKGKKASFKKQKIQMWRKTAFSTLRSIKRTAAASVFRISVLGEPASWRSTAAVK